MKKLFLFGAIFSVFFVACKSKEKEPVKSSEKVIAVQSYGEKISSENAISTKEMAAKFETLTVGDTIDVKFKSTVAEVCQSKGCWMKVPLNENQESLVKFKDYAFFMPLDAAGSNAVLKGKAFKNITSVDELQHYAKDAGKSEEEIAKITEPKVTYSFLADGVLLESASVEK